MKKARAPSVESSGKKSDFFSSFFPDFYFSFSHKAPKVASTRVSYDSAYRHWDKTLSLNRHVWHDNRRKSYSFGEGGEAEQDKKDLENMAAEDRIHKCYIRCQQPKDEIKRCNVCWEKDFGTYGFINNDDDAWKIFFDHATFSEIVTPTSKTIFQKPMYELRRSVEILPDDPCMKSFLSDSKKCPYDTCPDEIMEAPISRCQDISWYYKKWLQALRDTQEWYIGTLRKDRGFNDAIMIFMRVLHAARWHHDKDERRKAQELLIDNLIPEHKEYKTGLLPHYKILVPLRELLFKLANHLSRKCKADYLKGEDLNNVAVFKEFLIWAEENDLRIFNIASERETSGMQLIRKPAEYANSFLANHYHISMRTLKMSLKQSVARLIRDY